MAELAALQVGHHASTPAHPNLNKGQPGRWADLYEYIAACPTRGSGPTDHSRPTPSRRGATVGRMAQTQTPKATGCQGLHRASLKSETTSSNSKCIPGLATRIC